MKMWKSLTLVVAALLFAGATAAQPGDEEQQRELQSREVELTVRLKEAEMRMAEAARQIAEISSQRMPKIAQLERNFEMAHNKPRIGVTIDAEVAEGPVEGVRIGGVTPGSAADDAGLHAGDVITAINSESMSAENSHQANVRLLDFMRGTEEGDELEIEYLRNGNVGSVAVSPRVVEMHAFAWAPDEQQMRITKLHGLANAPQIVQGLRMDFGFPWAGSGLGNMELVELNKGLGKYFGTDTGLLVVSAPSADGIKLLDGDVIQSIDGRVPKDVRHAMRILSSYQSGETLELGIMRDKKKRKLKIEIPADHRSSLIPRAPIPATPARAVLAPRAPRAPVARTAT
jgi:C-terminal processing protease CtpA/Prc